MLTFSLGVFLQMKLSFRENHTWLRYILSNIEDFHYMDFNDKSKQIEKGYDDRPIDTTASINNPDIYKRKIFLTISCRAEA